MKTFFVLSALALAACSDVTAPTSLASSNLAPPGSRVDVVTNIHQKTPFTAVMVACNGEEVDVFGDQTFTFKLSTNDDGSTKLSVSNDAHFKGVGSVTGAKYEGSQKYTDKETTKLDDGTFNRYTFSTRTTLQLKGHGKVPDLFLNYSTKFTINADGSISHEDTDFSSSCK